MKKKRSFPLLAILIISFSILSVYAVTDISDSYINTTGPITTTGNSTSSWFNGLFNWTSSISWLSFDGSSLDFISASFPYTSLSNFTDDLGNRGYTHLTNFTNDLSFAELSTVLGFNYWNETYYGGIGNFSAWDKDYNDLINKPTIPTAVSDLTNDFGYYNSTTLPVGSYDDTWINSTFYNTTQSDDRYLQSYTETDSLAYNGTLAYNSSLANYYPLNNPYSYINDSSGFLTSESDPLWTGNQSFYATLSTLNNGTYNYDWNSTGLIINWSGDYATLSEILAFNYYNSTDFNINNYLLKSDWNATNTSYYLATNPFAFYNSTTIPTYLTEETNWNANYSDYLGLFLWNKTYADTLYQPVGSYLDLATLLGFDYYNSTDFSIDDYYLESNPLGFYNITTAPTYINDTFAGNYSTFLTHVTWSEVTNGTMAKISDLVNYNSTGLIINWTDEIDLSDYYTITQINSFDYYNDTNFPYTHLTNFTNDLDFAELSTILGFGYYNSTDFDINDYATLSTLNNGTYNYDWNSTGLIINWSIDTSSFLTSESDPVWLSEKDDYYLKSNPFAFYNSTTIPTYVETESDPKWNGNSTLVPYLASNNKFTANQNMTGNNVTNLNCIIFSNGGSWCGI